MLDVVQQQIKLLRNGCRISADRHCRLHIPQWIVKLLRCHGLSQYIKQMVQINAEVVKKLLLRRLKYVFKKNPPAF
jgi:hypothetical protein